MIFWRYRFPSHIYDSHTMLDGAHHIPRGCFRHKFVVDGWGRIIWWRTFCHSPHWLDVGVSWQGNERLLLQSLKGSTFQVERWIEPPTGVAISLIVHTWRYMRTRLMSTSSCHLNCIDVAMSMINWSCCRADEGTRFALTWIRIQCVAQNLQNPRNQQSVTYVSSLLGTARISDEMPASTWRLRRDIAISHITNLVTSPNVIE